ncbi:hypothetical protein [Prosthecobacter sp.]|uniref:hypothetical protein n=1 Tax=Prosthecobacter sp. TaxID=1965333 RepID=UPI0037834DF8
MKQGLPTKKIVCSLIALLVGCICYFWLPFIILESPENAPPPEGFRGLRLNLALLSIVTAGIAFEISQYLLGPPSKK